MNKLLDLFEVKMFQPYPDLIGIDLFHLVLMRIISGYAYRDKSRRSGLPLFTQPIMKGMQLDLLVHKKPSRSIRRLVAGQ